VTKKFALITFSAAILFVSCITREVSYRGKSVVHTNGSITRSGELMIAPAGEATGSQDSSEAFKFYGDNFEPLNDSQYAIHREFSDGVLKISWSATFAKDELPLSDYAHRTDGGPIARNNFAVDVKSRWFFKDYLYRETFSDPVEAAKYYPLIEEKLSQASQNILDSKPLTGLGDREGADAILSDLRSKTGVAMMEAFITDADKMDSLSELYDSQFEIAGDSLAGLAGVKLSADSAASLLKTAFDAAWDTLFTDHPEIFGSYGLAENEHLFHIEVMLPGCIKSGNADSVDHDAAVWNFKNADFFAREKTLEAISRDWLWGNVILTLAIVLLLLAFVLWPIRKRSAA